MKSRVLFTHSYFYRFDLKQWKFHQPYPPLGTIIAAAVVRQQGFDVSLFDTNLRTEANEITEGIREFRPKYVVIYDDGFNYLTKMCLTKMREAAFAMTRIAKKLGCILIVSSSDASDNYEKYFACGADYVVRGEGEETLSELLACLEKRKEPDSIAGLAFKKSGKTFATGTRPVMKDLDRLPLPAWDLVNIESYKKIWLRHHGYFSLNIATTRGCPFKCNWCAKPIYGNRYTSRSPENVITEIEFLKANYNPDHIWFCDDIFGLKPGWVNKFRDLIVEKNILLNYKIQSRVDLLLEDEAVKALKESGAETVWVGAESGSQKILDAMDKGTTTSQINDATQLLKRNNIKVAFFLQFGYLGETQEDILKTIDMVVNLLPDEVGISVSYPLPGTKFYETVKDQLREKRNWRDSDDLAMMFDSTYNSEYYRLLHRYVHSIYRKHKGYSVLRKLFRNPLRLNYKDLRTGLATFYYLPKAFAHQLKLKQLQTA
jgi:anaerobic magnesium-protoporphyrin IX monomethyl ester cyclase